MEQTDSDSAEEGEEMDEEEDESDGEEFGGFPRGQIPVFDPDVGEVAYTEDDGDDGVEDFRDAVEGGLEHMLETLEDDEDDDEDDHFDYGFIDDEHIRRHTHYGGNVEIGISPTLVLRC
jgi:hypothetical protein